MISLYKVSLFEQRIIEWYCKSQFIEVIIWYILMEYYVTIIESEYNSNQRNGVFYGKITTGWKVLILKFWQDICSLKIFCVFFIMVFFCILNISCSSSKQETRSEQTNTASTPLLPTTQEKTAVQDSVPSTASLHFAPIVNDTVTGVLYVTGNEPFTKVGLQTSYGTMYILKCTKEIESDLRAMQGKIVNVHYDSMDQIPEGQALKVVKIEYLQQRTVK